MESREPQAERTPPGGGGISILRLEGASSIQMLRREAVSRLRGRESLPAEGSFYLVSLSTPFLLCHCSLFQPKEKPETGAS